MKRMQYIIAVSVVNELDVIVSWNFEHIVKLKTKLFVNGINKMEGYKNTVHAMQSVLG